jgi:hypothetical protein
MLAGCTGGPGGGVVEDTFLSLWWIALAAVVEPLVASMVPARLVPGVLLLLGLGR